MNNIGPRVLAFVGYNSPDEYRTQKDKIYALSSSEIRPDILCDVSTCSTKGHLWEIVAQDTEFLPAAVPIYATVEHNRALSAKSILSDIAKCAAGGIKLITIHATPDKRLVELSSKRIVPCTSRGGAVVIKYALTDSFLGNLYSDIIDEISCIAREYGITISIGSVFRGANVFDAMDDVNIEEIHKQISIASYLKQRNVEVIIEGPGHISLNKISAFSQILCPSGFKVMPLGPVVADDNCHCEHVAAAIGAVHLGMQVEIANLAVVTCAEHAGGIPTFDQTTSAIASAKLASRLISSYRENNHTDDYNVAVQRKANLSCTTSDDCVRCGLLCPLRNCI
jgi:phosphomethylpyrimidine synthase